MLSPKPRKRAARSNAPYSSTSTFKKLTVDSLRRASALEELVRIRSPFALVRAVELAEILLPRSAAVAGSLRRLRAIRRRRVAAALGTATTGQNRRMARELLGQELRE